MSEAPETTPDRTRVFALAALVVALLGIGLSTYLAWHHNKATNTPGYQSFCSISQTIDCEAVNASKQSEIVIPVTKGGIRIPVALLSLVFYIGLTWLTFLRLREGRDDGLAAISYVFFLSLGGLAASGVMAFISFFVLKKLCLFCAGLYVVGLTMPIVSRLAAGTDFNSMLGELADDLKQHASGRVGVAAVAALIVLLGAKLPDWASKEPGGSLPQIAEQWKDAPKALTSPGSAYYKGASDPKVTVIEFADLQCPACRAEADQIRQVMHKHPGLLRVYFRHLPLDPKCNPHMTRTLHEYACGAAKAAECAGVQGKFWEYHDKLFTPVTEPKPDLKVDALRGYAQELDLDMDSFNDCFENDRTIEAKISDDIKEATFINARSTPTLVINGKKISRALTVAQWETILELEGFIDAQPEPDDESKTASHP